MFDLSLFDDRKILIVGDIILDRYFLGTVERISPEAPVPVLHQKTSFNRAGGAGNVACNVASLGSRATIISVVGDDKEAGDLGSILATQGVRFRAVVDRERPTICKTRLMAGTHQLARVDNEKTDQVSVDIEREIMNAILAEMPDHSIVVISDYGKGLFSPALLSQLISMAKERGLPIIVDPKNIDFRVYKGASVITPNQKELSSATGMRCFTNAEAELAMRTAADRTGSAILLTRSERGMTLLDNNEYLHIPTQAIDVFDVSGAGDTVVATLAVGIAAGFSLPQAARLSNAAAGIAVSRVGTATVSQNDLQSTFFLPVQFPDENQTLIGLIKKRETWASKGLKVGFTNGCFDLVHPGHVALLEFARQKCDKLIVAINSDASVRRLKGTSRPLQNEMARRRVLLSLRSVSEVVIFGEDTPLDLIKQLMPDVLVKGEDYRGKLIVGADVVTANGGTVLLAPLVEGQSTTTLAARASGGLRQ
ncbi:D-glycero-beta-D-manno-heptose-7-phosphate kinase (plasmid) [Rhizobium sp. CB3090]|uniref:D-glycero-beta-D-manno-heptose-7-phosphate kinase n=1 Tax=Rhizobium sp. CB3090 TaxID=3039156 RepID=UPI0024B14EA4|nr:D-glycero-beta-D-manno-heptose-7-phosphate kinase [Rhizobium sp. CB3090]WFU12347.1 D-glycero-beta-D-manno-heptose-7-phosphate kinase [Rhizobium sp. CB3090]